MRFLNENVFRTPHFFLDPVVLRRMEPEGALARIRTAQTAVLTAFRQQFETDAAHRIQCARDEWE